MPPPPLVVLVSGPPGTGKTTLARALSGRFGLPLFAKDRFKERMYDGACPDGDYARITPELSRLLGRCAMECLEVSLETCVQTATPAVFEANFHPRVFSARLARLREHHAMRIVQATLRCRGDVLLDRVIARAQTDRHPGHGGTRDLAAIMGVLLQGADEPLALRDGDEVFAIDTTDFAAVDIGPLCACIAQRLVTP